MEKLRLKTVVICLLTLTIGSTTAKAQYGNTVREDRLWDYEETIRHDGVDKNGIAYGYHFEGTKTIGEKTYAIFCDGENNPLALMREEENRVYLYVSMNKSVVPVPVAKVEDEDFEGDVLIYDYSLNKGDTYTSIGFDNLGHLDGVKLEIKIVDAYTITNSGQSYNCQEVSYANYDTADPDVFKPEWFGQYQIVEGVGYLKDGRLPFPTMGIYAPSGPYGESYSIYTVRDKEGNVIYASDRAGIDSVNADAYATDDAIYDLFGRRVETPAPGSLYIINGKKVLWK